MRNFEHTCISTTTTTHCMKSSREFSTCGIMLAFKTLQILETLPYMCVCAYISLPHIFIYLPYMCVCAYTYIALLRNMNFSACRSYDLCEFLKGSSMSLRVLPLLSSFFLFHSSANYSTIIIEHF